MLRDVIRPLIPRRLRHWHRTRIDLAYRAKSAWTAELERLRALPRYRSATTEMLGYRVEIPDTASFLEMYDEIFVREIFAFRSDRPAPRIIDGGANIGLVTLYYKRTFPDARVVAFEPDNAIYAVLTRNIEHWGLANVELHRAALAAEEKTLRFMSEGSYAGRVAREGDPVNGTVAAVRLRRWLEKPVDLLKLNIEGAETEVLGDCGDLLRNVRRAIIEYHSFAQEPQELSDLLSILREGGFRVHINPVRSPLRQPLLQREIVLGMDLQLAIYAYRP